MSVTSIGSSVPPVSVSTLYNGGAQSSSPSSPNPSSLNNSSPSTDPSSASIASSASDDPGLYGTGSIVDGYAQIVMTADTETSISSLTPDPTSNREVAEAVAATQVSLAMLASAAMITGGAAWPRSMEVGLIRQSLQSFARIESEASAEAARRHDRTSTETSNGSGKSPTRDETKTSALAEDGHGEAAPAVERLTALYLANSGSPVGLAVRNHAQEVATS